MRKKGAFMNSKKSKITFFVVAGFAVAAFTVSAFSFSFFDRTEERYRRLSTDRIYENLSKKSFFEICGEINEASAYGAELSDFIAHSAALSEKINEMSSEELVKVITDENNSDNLRIICIQLIDYDCYDFDEKSVKKLYGILQDGTEKSIIRQNLIWKLPSSKKTNDVLTNTAYDEDELVAFQALKRLNYDSPETAVSTAKKLLESEESGEKFRIAIKTISTQLRQSKNMREKDEWIVFCEKIIEKAYAENDETLLNTVVFSLADMRYSKAVYSIINNLYVEETIKKFCIEQNYQTFIDVLQNNPSDYDIRMAVNAMKIYPVDKSVEALKTAIDSKEEKYNIDEILSLEAIPANEKWNIE